MFEISFKNKIYRIALGYFQKYWENFIIYNYIGIEF